MMNKLILDVKNLSVHYGEFLAVEDISFSIKQGEIVSIIGANGAGKSTVMKSICGVCTPTSGSITFDGNDITKAMPHETVANGVAMVPEGRLVFPRLTVKENLLIGSFTPRARKNSEKNLKKIYDLFPILSDRSDQFGSSLSGGEQQMLAIGRALMSEPKLLLCDEISLGLAPVIIRDIYEKVKEINEDGLAIVLIEQDIKRSLKACDNAYVFLEGNVVLQGTPDELTEEAVTKAYFGT
jgi:branched-chain amino acid transport system ATP-binding protein